MELIKGYTQYYNKVNQALYDHNEIFVTLKNTEDPIFLPKKKYESDAGYDCRARIENPITLQPYERELISLGFGINIPLHYTGDLRPRSGLQYNHGIMIGYGTIDPGYTGEVKATVFNLGKEPFTIESCDRIAQLVIIPTALGENRHQTLQLKQIGDLIALDRGKNGHGSTGVK